MSTRRVGLFLVSDKTGYQRLLADSGRQAAKAASLPLEVFSADDTSAQQAAQVMRFLHTYPDDELAIVAMPVNDLGHEAPLASLARRVLARGIPWILLNRDVEDHVQQMRAEFPKVPVAQVTIDNPEVGRIQGRQALARLAGREGSVLLVAGSILTSAARDRRSGLLEVLKPPVAVHMVEGMWSADSAEKVAARWLASATGVDLLACQNDPMAVGARQALHRLARELGRPKWLEVPVLGVDGVPGEGQRLVDDKTLAATVIVPPTAGAAMEMLVRLWRSSASPEARVVLQPQPYPA